MNSKTILASTLVCSLTAVVPVALAGEIGHYAPGVPNIRDFAIPDPGFYGSVYNYWYSTDRLNGRNGNKVSSVTVGPRGRLTLGLDVNVDVYAVSPMFIWVSDWKLFGAKYAAYIAPSFSDASVGAALSTATGSGRSGNISSEFGVGDLFVQPLWLGWTLKHWDFALGYGFYAPVGRYNTETVKISGTSFKAESADNLGLGFWEHQIQGAASWYPWEDKRMAVSVALTYGIPQSKDGFDFRAGQNLTLNWGISQYLPLNKAESLLLEIGPAGYNSWQITDDSVSAAKNPGVHDEVHAVGGQLGLTYAPWNAALNFHYFYEFAAEDRFQGQSIGLNFAIKF